MTCDFVYTCIYAWLIYYTPLGHFLYLLSKELFFQLEDILRVSTMRTIYIYIYIYLFRYAHPFIAGRYLQKRPKRESRQNQQRICQRPGFRSSAGKSFHSTAWNAFIYMYIIVEIPNARQWLDFEVALPFAAILDCIVRKPWTLPDDSWLRAWHFLVCSPHIMQTLYNIFYLRFCRKHWLLNLLIPNGSVKNLSLR